MRAALLCIGFFLATLALQAQSVPDFTDTDKQAFTEVFWGSKELNSEEMLSIAIDFDSIDISAERYREILQARIQGDELELSDVDKMAIRQLDSLKTGWAQQFALGVDALCLEAGIDASTYREMLWHYRSDIEFQRSFRELFNSYIQRDRE